MRRLRGQLAGRSSTNHSKQILVRSRVGCCSWKRRRLYAAAGAIAPAMTLGLATLGGGGAVDRRRPASLLLPPRRCQRPAHSRPSWHVSPGRREGLNIAADSQRSVSSYLAVPVSVPARVAPATARDEPAVDIEMGRFAELIPIAIRFDTICRYHFGLCTASFLSYELCLSEIITIAEN